MDLFALIVQLSAQVGTKMIGSAEHPDPAVHSVTDQWLPAWRAAEDSAFELDGWNLRATAIMPSASMRAWDMKTSRPSRSAKPIET